MVTLSQQLKLLADGFRKRYGKTETLTLADMTKLVTPPAFLSGINLIKEPIHLNLDGSGPKSKSATFDVIPPQMSKPITLTLTLQAKQFLWISNGSLILTKDNGEELKLTIPGYSSEYNASQTFTHDFTVTIPANTSLANGQFTISFPNYSHNIDTITQIIATY